MPFLCRESPNVLRGFVSPAFLIAAAHVFPRFLQSIRGCEVALKKTCSNYTAREYSV